jgi:hypothetical protein
MKIISDYKDYYDYVIGYDTDPRKVYLRTRKDVREQDKTGVKAICITPFMRIKNK